MSKQKNLTPKLIALKEQFLKDGFLVKECHKGIEIYKDPGSPENKGGFLPINPLLRIVFDYEPYTKVKKYEISFSFKFMQQKMFRIRFLTNGVHQAIFDYVNYKDDTVLLIFFKKYHSSRGL